MNCRWEVCAKHSFHHLFTEGERTRDSGLVVTFDLVDFLSSLDLGSRFDCLPWEASTPKPLLVVAKAVVQAVVRRGIVMRAPGLPVDRGAGQWWYCNGHIRF